jgi:hypothetical protein
MEEEFSFRKSWSGILHRAFGRKKAQRQMLPRNDQPWESEGELCFEKRAEILRYPLLSPSWSKSQWTQKYRSVIGASFHGFQLTGVLSTRLGLLVVRMCLFINESASGIKHEGGPLRTPAGALVEVVPIAAILFQLAPSFRKDVI